VNFRDADGRESDSLGLKGGYSAAANGVAQPFRLRNRDVMGPFTGNWSSPGALRPRFGPWKFTCDREATATAYSRASHGNSDRCTCNECRNFSAARLTVYPAQFVAFLESLGIDPRKDGEVYHNARIGPNRHYYGGWFHFIGELYKTGDFPNINFTENFSASLDLASAPHLASLDGYGLVQIDFHADNVPWILDDPEAL
jgi:hypothetical protein